METKQTGYQGSAPTPRQIPIQVLDEDEAGSSMKILHMPSSSKVVDFRQITMKSDFNQALLGGMKKETRPKVENNDVILRTNQVFSLKKEGLRPLLPKPSVISTSMASKEGTLLFGEGSSSSVRIKQVSRIGGAGEKMNVIEIVPQTPGDGDVTPSTSKTSMASSGGSRGARRKYNKRSYYAYVTESESEGEEPSERKKKAGHREEVLSGRRSKRASMSQKLAQWGLLPSGKDEVEGIMDDDDDDEDDDDDGMVRKVPESIEVGEMLKGEVGKIVSVDDDDDIEEEEEEEEEDDDEPLIAAPPPQFINVPISTSAPHIALISSLVAVTKPPTKPLMVLAGSNKSTTAATSSTKPTTIEMEKEINSVLDLEDLLSDIERNRTSKPLQLTTTPLQTTTLLQPTTTPIQANTPLQRSIPIQTTASPLKYITPLQTIKPPHVTSLPPTSLPPTSRGLNSFQKHTPFQVKVPIQQVASMHGSGTVLKTMTPSGWLKKASNMLGQQRTTPAFKRMDTMNKSLMCKPIMLTKGTTFNPLRTHKAAQTDQEEVLEKKSMVVPIPVPIYLPTPTTPALLPSIHPLPLPIPLLCPLPIPTSRSAISNLIQQAEQQLAMMQSVHGDMSPLERDLMEMADLLDSTKSQQDRQLEQFNASIIRGVNDSNYVYPGVTPSTNRRTQNKEDEYEWLTRSTNASLPDGTKNFMNATVPGSMDSSRCDDSDMRVVPQGPRSTALPLNDHRMTFKYSYALKAWRYWTEQKNLENSKRAGMQRGRGQFFFQADPLKSSAEQLSGCLAYFARDVRRLDGSKFAPDSVFFLCLGIQQYLRENGRDDNIFADAVYHKFTDALNDVLYTFEMKINPQNMLICRVTEDHLWEVGQLGCHSPHILLFTLIFISLKHFLLTSPDHHLKLTSSSFQVTTENKDGQATKKLCLKSSGEQGGAYENSEDPLKCPVNMFQFYVNKCPDTQKSFYCLPEASAVKSDTHFWFSQNPLSRGAVTKMVNRCLVVREVQVANLQHMQIEG